MNFKRGKSKRVVRCTLCTKTRWMGNAKSRWKDREVEAKKIARSEMRMA